MAKFTIITGTPNSKTGDSLYAAFNKVNANFNELYDNVAFLTGNLQSAIPLVAGQAGKILSTNGVDLIWVQSPPTSELTNGSATATFSPTGVLNLPASGGITINGQPFLGIASTTLNPPANAIPGTLWYDIVSGRTYIRYDNSWIDASPRGATGAVIPNQNGFGGKFLTTDGSNLSWAAVGAVVFNEVESDILPLTDNTYNLGSPDKQWKHLFVSGGSIYLGDIKLTNTYGKLTVTQVINPGEFNEEEVLNPPPAFFDQSLNTTDEVYFSAVFSPIFTSTTGVLGLTPDVDHPGGAWTLSSQNDGLKSVLSAPMSNDVNTGVLVFPGTSGSASISWVNDGVGSPLANIRDSLVVSTNEGDISLVINAASSIIAYKFGQDGVIELPAGGDIVDSNGNSVLGGGGSENYTPSIPSNWITPVSTISGALDQLAARIAALENNDVDGGSASDLYDENTTLDGGVA